MCRAPLRWLGPAAGRLADPVQGVLKSTIDDDAIGLSPTNALLIRDGVPRTPAPAAAQGLAPGDSDSGSGLSSGAIAGIAVGSAAAVAATAGAAWVLLQRRGRTAGAEAGSHEEERKLEADSAAALEVGGASPATSSLADYGSAPTSAQTTAVSAASQGSGAFEGGIRSVTHPASAARLGSPFVGRPTASPFASRPAGRAASLDGALFSGGASGIPSRNGSTAAGPFASGRASLDGASFGSGASGFPSRNGSAAASAAAPLTSVSMQRAPSAASPFAAARAHLPLAAQPSSPAPDGSAPLSLSESAASSAPISAAVSSMSASPAVASPPQSGSASSMMLPEVGGWGRQWRWWPTRARAPE